MTDLGLDYAFPPRPDLDAVWAAGYRFVSRYLSWLPNPKCIDAAELAALLAHGLEVALNWEFDAQDALGGASAGNLHGTEAVRQATALGYPAGCTIYFSADFDETPAQAFIVDAYMRAAAAHVHGAGYRMGAYGGYWTILRLFDAGSIDDGWQTYGWSGGQWDARVALRQVHNGAVVGGADCDIDQRVGQTYLMRQHTEGEMAVLKRDPVSGAVWVGNYVTRRHVTSQQEWIALRSAAGVTDLGDLAAGESIDWYGVDVSAAAAPDLGAIEAALEVALEPAIEAAAAKGAKAGIDGATIHTA